MKIDEKELLKEWCDICEKEYGEKCWQCPMWGFLKGVDKVYGQGWTMAQAFRWFIRLAPNPDEARKTLEEVIGAPLHIVQILLREIDDYEKQSLL